MKKTSSDWLPKSMAGAVGNSEARRAPRVSVPHPAVTANWAADPNSRDQRQENNHVYSLYTGNPGHAVYG